MKKIRLLFLFIVFFYSCDDDTVVVEENQDVNLILLFEELTNEYGGIETFILPDENDFSSIPQDSRNKLSQSKVELGKLLFHETALAINPIKGENIYTYSCASCHSAGAGFQAAKEQGIGEGGIGFGVIGEQREIDPNYDPTEIDVQDIRSPTIINSAFQENMLWNGQFGATGLNEGTENQWIPTTPPALNNLGFEGLETQAIAALDIHRQGIDIDLLAQYGYKELFDDAFAEIPENERYTEVTAGLAIAAFERTVFSNNAPFQRWLKGDLSAMTENQKKGAILFFDKAKCVTCHNGPALNSMDFFALGMNDLNGNIHGTITSRTKLGRGGFTEVDEDNYKFKVPQLYNLKDSPFYGHGGSLQSIKQVIEYKNNATPENLDVPQNQLSAHFIPLLLSDLEINQLVDFIENGLYDDNLNRYEPISLPSGFCFPNADTQSIIDLNCN